MTHGSGKKAGKIIFKRGEIIDVQCEDDRGEDALRYVITFKDGIFAFTRRAMDDMPVTVRQNTMSLLMNTLKTLDEDGGNQADTPAAGAL